MGSYPALIMHVDALENTNINHISQKPCGFGILVPV
jgi:hypothetical protein